MVMMKSPLLLLTAAAASAVAQTLPIVDLGYVRQQATGMNVTGNYYNFSNIRFAQAPVGNLRFALPLPPSGINSSIDNGAVSRICPQAMPDWEGIATSFIPDYLTGQVSKFDFNSANASAFEMPIKAQSGDATEDCLFLDVMVPEKIFNAKGTAPVLVWIYGGGFTGGSKVSSGSSAGLLAASQANGGDGAIFVAMNYRLGALGWLAGSTVEASGVANAGLHDQRLALAWVQKNVHLFGGDPNQVTVMGESAGASSILHQITAFGNSSQAPFQRAILQSPAFEPMPDPVGLEATAQDFLSILGVSSIAEARAKDSAAVIAANSQQVQQSLYGSFSYGPAVDNLIAPALPGQLLAQGRFSKDVMIMVGHNQDEGLLFSDPEVNTTEAMSIFLQTAYPSLSLSVIAYIENVLYPADYSGTYGYTTAFTRYVQLISEYAVTCNSVYLENAVDNNNYAYQFAVGPALHGEDIGYTFNDGSSADAFGLPLNLTNARLFQRYLTSFVTTGTPSAGSSAAAPAFPLYGATHQILNLGGSGFTTQADDVNRTRCAFWQQGLFLGQDVSPAGVGIAVPPALVITAAPSPAAPYTAPVPSAVSPSAPVAEGSGLLTAGAAAATGVVSASASPSSTESAASSASSAAASGSVSSIVASRSSSVSAGVPAVLGSATAASSNSASSTGSVSVAVSATATSSYTPALFTGAASRRDGRFVVLAAAAVALAGGAVAA